MSLRDLAEMSSVILVWTVGGLALRWLFLRFEKKRDR